jgi:hypothetical protein
MQGNGQLEFALRLMRPLLDVPGEHRERTRTSWLTNPHPAVG